LKEEFDVENVVKGHTTVINDNILPRLDAVEKQQAEYNIQQAALKNDVQSVSLSQQELKNTMVGIHQDQKSTMDKLLTHVMTMQTAEHQSKEKITIKKLSGKEQVKLALITMFGTILGGGAIVGIVQLFL
jgi:Ni,Fe-hydrogenase III component G